MENVDFKPEIQTFLYACFLQGKVPVSIESTYLLGKSFIWSTIYFSSKTSFDEKYLISPN